jgi:hypothetical protein
MQKEESMSVGREPLGRCGQVQRVRRTPAPPFWRPLDLWKLNRYSRYETAVSFLTQQLQQSHHQQSVADVASDSSSTAVKMLLRL